MKNLCIKDKDTENINPYDLSLSILISKGGFSYVLYNKELTRFSTLVSQTCSNPENCEAEFKAFILKEELNLNKFHKLNIVVADERTTIVPEALFQSNKINDIYNLNFFPNTERSVKYSRLDKSGNYLIFSVSKNIIKVLDELFTEYNLFPQSHSFIESHFIDNKLSDNPLEEKMYVQVFNDFCDILVLKDSDVRFYNTYTYKTNNDLLYYIINIFDQLKLSQEETKLVFSGFVETDNLAVINLRKFISQVYFESQNINYKYFYKFQETLPHYYYNFLNIVSCV
ncbi:MAG: DUF3822 family protein [Bacteroidales bacterium]|nr:DUF3822 family protein [Bacteroidales bacterium]